MRESQYQAGLIKRIEKRLPGCLIIKNDSAARQGIPDLTILWRWYWAQLEVKISEDADWQPNQDYYVRTLNDMSFAAFIYPENEEAVLNDLQEEFTNRWASRLS